MTSGLFSVFQGNLTQESGLPIQVLDCLWQFISCETTWEPCPRKSSNQQGLMEQITSRSLPGLWFLCRFLLWLHLRFSNFSGFGMICWSHWFFSARAMTRSYSPQRCVNSWDPEETTGKSSPAVPSFPLLFR